MSEFDYDFTMDQELERQADVMESGFVPFQPDRRGRLPEYTGKFEEWSHFQTETAEIVAASMQSDERSDIAGAQICTIDYEIIDEDSPGFGWTFREWLRFWPPTDRGLSRATRRSMSKIRNIVTALGLEEVRNADGKFNTRATVNSGVLTGVKFKGDLRQGYREGWNPETKSGNGHFYKIQEFVSFDPIKE